MDKEGICKNLSLIWEEIEKAATVSGRKGEEITLVAVSKHKPVEMIEWARECGQRCFGENYVQEALDKLERLTQRDVEFHFIGRCQSNKAKYLPGKFSMVHSLDSMKFASLLDKRCGKLGETMKVLIEVKVAEEDTKGGVGPNGLFSFVEQFLDSIENLQLEGLMCMPPYFSNPERVRPYFASLRKMKDELEQRFGLHLPHLSMGMSSDFKEAIMEGATLVRVGTRIFGPRD